MQAQATAKYLRTGDRKVGTVLKLIRGKKVEEALTILRFTERRAAEMVEKALKSAIANGNQGESKLDLGEGPRGQVRGQPGRLGAQRQALHAPRHGPRQRNPQAPDPPHHRPQRRARRQESGVRR